MNETRLKLRDPLVRDFNFSDLSVEAGSTRPRGKPQDSEIATLGGIGQVNPAPTALRALAVMELLLQTTEDGKQKTNNSNAFAKLEADVKSGKSLTDAFVNLNPNEQSKIEAKIGNGYLAELLSISEETHERISFEKFLHFGIQLKSQRDFDQATLVLGALAQAEGMPQVFGEVPDSVRTRALEQYEALIGKGDVGRRIGVLADRLQQDSFDLHMIVPMIGASALGEIVGAAYVGKFLGAGKWYSQPWIARVGAGLMGYAAEAPAFALLNRAATPNSEAPFLDDLARAGLTIGALKFCGFTGKYAAKGLSETSQFISQQLATFLGMATSHKIEELIHLRKAVVGETFVTDTISSMITMGVGSHLGVTALGARYAKFQRDLHIHTETIGAGLVSAQLNTDSSRNWNLESIFGASAEWANTRLAPTGVPGSWQVMSMVGMGGRGPSTPTRISSVPPEPQGRPSLERLVERLRWSGDHYLANKVAKILSKLEQGTLTKKINEVLSSFQKSSDPDARSHAFMNLANELVDMGEVARALEILRRSPLDSMDASLGLLHAVKKNLQEDKGVQSNFDVIQEIPDAHTRVTAWGLVIDKLVSMGLIGEAESILSIHYDKCPGENPRREKGILKRVLKATKIKYGHIEEAGKWNNFQIKNKSGGYNDVGPLGILLGVGSGLATLLGSERAYAAGLPGVDFSDISWGEVLSEPRIYLTGAFITGATLFIRYHLRHWKMEELGDRARNDPRALKKLAAMVELDNPNFSFALARAAEGNPEAVFLFEKLIKQFPAAADLKIAIKTIDIGRYQEFASKDHRWYEALEILNRYFHPKARNVLFAISEPQEKSSSNHLPPAATMVGVGLGLSTLLGAERAEAMERLFREPVSSETSVLGTIKALYDHHTVGTLIGIYVGGWLLFGLHRMYPILRMDAWAKQAKAGDREALFNLFDKCDPKNEKFVNIMVELAKHNPNVVRNINRLLLIKHHNDDYFLNILHQIDPAPYLQKAPFDKSWAQALQAMWNWSHLGVKEDPKIDAVDINTNSGKFPIGS